jgi:hypothetical protein
MMKTKISVELLLSEANRHEAIAGQYRQIAEYLRLLNPSVELLIDVNKPQTEEVQAIAESTPEARANDSHGDATKMDALVQVLNEHGKPMEKWEILRAMEKRGSPITKATLTSYLSRNRNIKFKNPLRGFWKLTEQTQPARETDKPSE